jgi:hypothetical protein
VLLAVILGLGFTAGMVARGFVSPAQQAARAAPPAPSLITARVDYGVLPVQLVLRADVNHGSPITVGAPSKLAGDPVVTSVNVSAGEQITDGQLLGTVAEQPVFVMSGRIPAFRDMVPGTRGVDVLELQRGLASAGYGIGTDAPGFYGPGTAAALRELYRAADVQPDVAPSAGEHVARRSADVTRAAYAVAAAAAKLASDKKRSVAASVIAADREALRTTKAALAAAQDALAAAQRADEAVVPLGEVTFMRQLPAQVLSVAQLGSTVASGGAGSSGQSGSKSPSGLAVIGSAAVRLSASAGQAITGQLRPGMKATATSDTSGATLEVKISQIAPGRVVFVPAGRIPAGMVGQNVQVVVVTRQVKSFIVPVAALSTNGAGQVYVTVTGGSGGEQVVLVRLGLQSGGRQAVSPVHGALRAGDQVVIGEQTG